MSRIFRLNQCEEFSDSLLLRKIYLKSVEKCNGLTCRDKHRFISSDTAMDRRHRFSGMQIFNYGHQKTLDHGYRSGKILRGRYVPQFFPERVPPLSALR